jgi:hypothetical protein
MSSFAAKRPFLLPFAAAGVVFPVLLRPARISLASSVSCLPDTFDNLSVLQQELSDYYFALSVQLITFCTKLRRGGQRGQPQKAI